MSYQLPPLLDDQDFERLVRDISRRVFNDPGIERFGRKGQAQSGIDGFSPSDSTITFQCKLKDTRYEKDSVIRTELMKELEEELSKTSGLSQPLTRFIFASTFKNDTHLQQKASSLSSDSLTVEYWGWDTISERTWEFADELIPRYYPQFPVRPINGFRQITVGLIEAARISERDQLNTLALDYYRINDRSELVFQVVCNDVDVRNSGVMDAVYRRLEGLTAGGTLWLVGDGGSGKTTILHRLAFELAERGDDVFTLDLERHLSRQDVQSVLSILKFGPASRSPVLCIDNPAADEAILERLLRELPGHSPNIRIILSEREHRYRTLVRTGVLTYLHGEDETVPVKVRNPRNQRETVYQKLFDLLAVPESDRESLRDIVRNERLVYVNATYSILLELKKKRRIDFDFDWDDYRKTAADTPAFSEAYKYIALFYLFGVRTPFVTLSRLCGADVAQQRLFLEKFRGLLNEPIVVDEWRDESLQKVIHLRTKHEIVSEIFFRVHRDLEKDDLLMDWCKETNFSDQLEVQALINIFGLKKNYLAESSAIDFERIIEFLLNGHIREHVNVSAKLVGTLHLAKFWLLMLRNKTDEAIALLESFVKAAPENLHTRTELAKIYQRQGRLTEAEAMLQQVLTSSPDDINSRTELAKIHQKQNRLAEAEAELLEILNIRNGDLNSRTELAKIYQRQGKYDQAESVLRELLEKDRNNVFALTELARVYKSQDRLAEAELLLQNVLRVRRLDLNSRTELAKIYQRQGKLGEAESVLMELLRLEPDDLQARTELAKIYQRQGKLDEAERLLLESLEIDEKQLHPRTELAKIYQRQGKLGEAESVLMELLRLEPDDLQARTELAKIYQRQGKLDEAARLLIEELKLAPRALHPRTELAKIYQREGKLDEAERLLLDSLEIDEKQLHPRTELAKIYQRQGKLDEAALTAEEILALDPLNDFAISELLGIWTRQGDKTKCRERYLSFIGQPKYNFTRYSQAPVFRFFRCCEKFGMTEEARMVFERFEAELDDRNIDFYKSSFPSPK